MVSLTELDFDPLPHVYRWRGRELPSVTKLMRRYGIGFQGIAPEEALRRGQAVHDATVLIDQDDLDEEYFPAKWRGYLEGYRRWLADTRAKALQAETRLFDPRYLFAGTFDRVIMRAGERILVEIKTGDATDWDVQAAGYRRLWTCWHPDKPIHAGEGLKLNDDGTYHREPLNLDNGWRVFAALLVIEERRRSHGRRGDDREAA